MMKTNSTCFLFFAFWAISFSSLSSQKTTPEKTSKDSLAITKYIAKEEKKFSEGTDVKCSFVLQNFTIIDGTGANPLPNQTIVIQNGLIAEISDSDTFKAPEGALSMDLPESMLFLD